MGIEVCFTENDTLTNSHKYPKDEVVYKDFNEVLNSVRLARLRARFVIKDSDDSLRGAA